MNTIRKLAFLSLILLCSITMAQTKEINERSIQNALEADPSLSKSFKTKTIDYLFAYCFPRDSCFHYKKFDLAALKTRMNKFEQACLNGDGKNVVNAKFIINARKQFPDSDKAVLKSRYDLYWKRLAEVYNE